MCLARRESTRAHPASAVSSWSMASVFSRPCPSRVSPYEYQAPFLDTTPTPSAASNMHLHVHTALAALRLAVRAGNRRAFCSAGPLALLLLVLSQMGSVSKHPVYIGGLSWATRLAWGQVIRADCWQHTPEAVDAAAEEDIELGQLVRRGALVLDDLRPHGPDQG